MNLIQKKSNITHYNQKQKKKKFEKKFLIKTIGENKNFSKCKYFKFNIGILIYKKLSYFILDNF